MALSFAKEEKPVLNRIGYEWGKTNKVEDIGFHAKDSRMECPCIVFLIGIGISKIINRSNVVNRKCITVAKVFKNGEHSG